MTYTHTLCMSCHSSANGPSTPPKKNGGTRTDYSLIIAASKKKKIPVYVLSMALLSLKTSTIEMWGISQCFSSSRNLHPLQYDAGILIHHHPMLYLEQTPATFRLVMNTYTPMQYVNVWLLLIIIHRWPLNSFIKQHLTGILDSWRIKKISAPHTPWLYGRAIKKSDLPCGELHSLCIPPFLILPFFFATRNRPHFSSIPIPPYLSLSLSRQSAPLFRSAWVSSIRITSLHLRLVFIVSSIASSNALCKSLKKIKTDLTTPHTHILIKTRSNFLQEAIYLHPPPSTPPSRSSKNQPRNGSSRPPISISVFFLEHAINLDPRDKTRYETRYAPWAKLRPLSRWLYFLNTCLPGCSSSRPSIPPLQPCSAHPSHSTFPSAQNKKPTCLLLLSPHPVHPAGRLDSFYLEDIFLLGALLFHHVSSKTKQKVSIGMPYNLTVQKQAVFLDDYNSHCLSHVNTSRLSPYYACWRTNPLRLSCHLTCTSAHMWQLNLIRVYHTKDNILTVLRTPPTVSSLECPPLIRRLAISSGSVHSGMSGHCDALCHTKKKKKINKLRSLPSTRCGLCTTQMTSWAMAYECFPSFVILWNQSSCLILPTTLDHIISKKKTAQPSHYTPPSHSLLFLPTAFRMLRSPFNVGKPFPLLAFFRILHFFFIFFFDDYILESGFNRGCRISMNPYCLRSVIN
ncbi:hypothetical protein VP01_1111g8 [Puccinia sorghi]|uniref:Uncharacterized protein n=1 Tax=Puccinia sorghi TaxID=27349 RepID=A0A0L6VSV4_9BASI|nr:hypothetical protein VP01_1111g8 [Puccinia sorghi]